MVASARKLIGATNPLASEPGTIRGDFAINTGRNVIHGSDSPENGDRETGEGRRRGRQAHGSRQRARPEAGIHECMQHGLPVSRAPSPISDRLCHM